MVRKRQRWQAKDIMEEIVRMANENEVYPSPFQFNEPSLEKNLTGNNLGQSTLYWQQIYLLYAQFSFSSY